MFDNYDEISNLPVLSYDILRQEKSNKISQLTKNWRLNILGIILLEVKLLYFSFLVIGQLFCIIDLSRNDCSWNNYIHSTLKCWSVYIWEVTSWTLSIAEQIEKVTSSTGGCLVATIARISLITKNAALKQKIN